MRNTLWIYSGKWFSLMQITLGEWVHIYIGILEELFILQLDADSQRGLIEIINTDHMLVCFSALREGQDTFVFFFFNKIFFSFSTTERCLELHILENVTWSFMHYEKSFCTFLERWEKTSRKVSMYVLSSSICSVLDQHLACNPSAFSFFFFSPWSVLWHINRSWQAFLQGRARELTFCVLQAIWRASLVAQKIKKPTRYCRRRRFDPWVGKIPLRREW